ncbi:MAG: cation:proton antiporter, partial [Tissierellales bacterium]|nr:cation:proton antiporter [Tissierellales bacterium]
MSENKEKRENIVEESTMGFFEKYLSIWVALCIAAGVAIGHYLPIVPEILSEFEYAKVSIPVAILIWLMIYPMMLKIDFSSIVDSAKQPKGLAVTMVTNWLIKPFTMYLIAYFFFNIVFKNLISPSLAKEYLAGAVLLGAAPCTAMVFVWSHLTKGNPAYTVVQVALNDLVLLVLGPYSLDLISSDILNISPDLREIALIVILLKAGLTLDLEDLKKVGRPAFLLSFIPATLEIAAITVLAPLLFNMPYIEAAILGTVVAAVSPAVIVPRMIFLIQHGFGKEKSIPHMILAAASVDDVFVIVLFTAFLNMYKGSGFSLLSLISVPISIVSGVILGILVGLILIWFFK